MCLFHHLKTYDLFKRKPVGIGISVSQLYWADNSINENNEQIIEEMPGEPKQHENLSPLISNAFWAYKYNGLLISLCFYKPPTNHKKIRDGWKNTFFINFEGIKKTSVFICIFGPLLASRPLLGGLGAGTRNSRAHIGDIETVLKTRFLMICRGSIKNNEIKKPLYL